MLSDAEKDALLAAVTSSFSRSGTVKLIPGTDRKRSALRVRMRELSSLIGVRVVMAKSSSDSEVLLMAQRALERWIEDDRTDQRTSSGVAPG